MVCFVFLSAYACGDVSMVKDKIKAFLLKEKKLIINLLYGLLITLFFIFLDQLFKALVHNYFKVSETAEVIPKFFHITYQRNRGAAFSFLEGKQWLFITIGVIFSLIISYFFKYFDLRKRLGFSLAIAMLLAGTLGNLFDRIYHGYVIDFYDFTFGSYQFATFNIADSLLTLGIVILVIDSFIGETKDLWKK